MFCTKYDVAKKRGWCSGCYNDGKRVTDSTGYLPPKARIESMMGAGASLAQSRGVGYDVEGYQLTSLDRRDLSAKLNAFSRRQEDIIARTDDYGVAPIYMDKLELEDSFRSVVSRVEERQRIKQRELFNKQKSKKAAEQKPSAKAADKAE